jgi:hypothetical protein
MSTWKPLLVLLLAAGAMVGSDAAASRSDAQALRTCVDRWNQSNMVGWGPGAANVAFRRPLLKERRSISLSRARQCIVAIAVGDGSWTCVLADSGAYWCPPLHEPTGPALKRNSQLDAYGVLTLDRRPKDTHATPRLPWQRYPHVDGYVQPWTPAGKLRPGLRFKGSERGRCFLVSETVYSGLSCLAPDLERYEACFPRRRDGGRGELAACAYGPGYTRFTRWTMTAEIPSPQPLLMRWRGIGDIHLGEPKRRVVREYRSQGTLGRYVLDFAMPGGRVQVGFDAGRVSAIWFSTPYYRTNGGFGVGSTIPRGRRWHGFIWNGWRRQKPCGCWVKVGRRAHSLPATPENFLKPWTFVDVRDGHVASFYFAARFVD